MKLYELKEIIDMLNPECEVVVQKPGTPPRKIGFEIPQSLKEGEQADEVK